MCHRYVDDRRDGRAAGEAAAGALGVPARGDHARGRHGLQPRLLRWTVTEGAAARGTWTLDGDTSGTLRRAGGAWVALLDRESVQPGAHTLRAELADTQGRVTGRTVSFYVNGGTFDVQWRENLGGSCQSAPLVAGGRVYVGDNSGALTILSRPMARISERGDRGRGALRARDEHGRTDDRVRLGGRDHARD